MTATTTSKPSLAWEILFIFILCSAQLMTQSGLALSIVPSHLIGESFGVQSPTQLSWFSAAYSLTVGTFILIAGRLGDLFGYKKFFVSGYIWYAIWSIVAGLSVYSNTILFDFSRAMQGIGPAFLLPNAIAIIGQVYNGQHPKQEMIFSLFGATAPGGFVIGAVFCSLISQSIGWPWAYHIMGIACVVFAIMGFFVLPAAEANEDEKPDNAPLWQQLDVPGSITGVISLILINFAWNQGASVGWEQPYIGVILGIGALFLAAFIVIEIKSPYPLVPFQYLDQESVLSLACIAAGWASFGIFILYLLNVLEVLRQQSPLLSSAQMVPVAISGLCAAICTGLVITKIRISFVMLIALTAFTVGGIIFATMPVEQVYWAQLFVGLLVLPWGMDMSFPASTIVLSQSMPKRYQGTAASLVNTVLNYSISIGLGIAGTVELYLDRQGATIEQGFRSAWWVGVGFAGLGFCIALTWCIFIKPKKNTSVEAGEA